MSGGMSTPFNMDLANQIAQTQGFEGLVDTTLANNNRMMAVADYASVANMGKLSGAFQTYLNELHTCAQSNNQTLETIASSLKLNIGATDGQEDEGATNLFQLTGMIPSGHQSGSHFGPSPL